MATWPTTIPILRDGYVETPPSRVLRSGMDKGPDKIRRYTSSAVRPVTIKLFLTDAQIDILDTFYDENDALAFDFTNPRTEEVVKARFIETPPYELKELMYNVAVDLEILP